MSIPFNQGQLSLLSSIMANPDESVEIGNSSTFGFTGYTNPKAVHSLQSQGWIEVKPVSFYSTTRAWTVYMASIPDTRKERVHHWLSQGQVLNNKNK